MKKLKMLLGISLPLLINISCAAIPYEIPNFKAHITLPASEDGFGIETITRNEVTIPAAKWHRISKKGIIILPEDYKILKTVIRKNCHTHECKEAIGTLDNLFLVIDEALQKIPTP